MTLDARGNLHAAAGARGAGEFTSKVNTRQPDQLYACVREITAFSEPFDQDEFRPLRPYLPLTVSDDDEFFDAPIGSILRVAHQGAERQFQKTSSDEWHELSERGRLSSTPIPAGEVWVNLFDSPEASAGFVAGEMKPALLQLTHGTLFSDGHFFVTRQQVDDPITVAEASAWLQGATARMVSRSIFGDTRDDGIPAQHRGELTFDVADGHAVYRTAGAHTAEGTRGITLDSVELFDRNGDIVLRYEKDSGYGWEETFRIDDTVTRRR